MVYMSGGIFEIYLFNKYEVEENKQTAKKYGAEIIILDDISPDMMLDVNQDKVSDEMLN